MRLLIPVSAGSGGYVFTEIDPDDYEKVSQLTRLQLRRGYVYGQTRSGKEVRLHRYLLDCPDEFVVDHIDGARLNNRRANLRVCTVAQNGRNRGANTGKSFKGIYYEPERGKWRARIRKDYEWIRLGRFDTPEAAARAYDTAAREYHGEFARLNFPAEH